MPDHHTHYSPGLNISAIHWLGEPNCAQVFDLLGLGSHPTPEEEQDHSRITLHGGHLTAHPGDWIVRMTVRAPVADHDQGGVLRELLEYALATLDLAEQGPDAHLDDSDA